MRDRGGRLIWLAYINQTLPRSRGRKIPKDLAVPNPKIEEVLRALDDMGCRVADVQPEKRYPRAWFEEHSKGYVVVDCRLSKRELLKSLALRIRSIRRGSSPQSSQNIAKESSPFRAGRRSET